MKRNVLGKNMVNLEKQIKEDKEIAGQLFRKLSHSGLLLKINGSDNFLNN